VTRPGFQAIDLITHRAAIVGRAIDQRTQASLVGVAVVITGGPPAWSARLTALQQGQPGARPDRVISAANGFFRWLDLPVGVYSLNAALPGTRYATATGSATVVTTGPVSVDLALAPTTLIGTINATGSPAGPLANARVRFADSDGATYTAIDGSFTLSPIEAGTNRVLEVSAQNYVTTTRPVTLSQGQTTTASIITLNHG
jgi:hypothetical protein